MPRADGNAIQYMSGTVPGLVDPSQPSRLLRTAACSLFFASFDPHTARADLLPNISNLNIGSNGYNRINPETAASTNGKRVVVETDPENGTCTWRFVPRARTEDGVSDEGPWPRLVEFCGLVVRMAQDQWDIHKLDPEYACVVRKSPNLTTITRVSRSNASRDDSGVPVTPSEPERNQQQKAPTADPDDMVVEEDIFFSKEPGFHENVHDMMDNSKKRGRILEHIRNSELSAPSSGSDSCSDDDEAHGMPGHAQFKKFRTRSPKAIRREMERKRRRRERKRKVELDARVKARQDVLREAFWENLGIDPFIGGDFFQRDEGENLKAEADDTVPNDTASECEDDEEKERLARIEESRRKLAELEKDKPLWEESARRRRQKEMEEEYTRKREKEKREREARNQEEARASQKRREEQRKQGVKERERQENIRKQSGRMFVSRPRNSFRWNSRLALDRYLRISADFDKTRFTVAEISMNFARVPWPVLHASFSIQDIDWDAVEAFFGEIQKFLTPAEFKEVVEKSHRRFHPDRWRSRGLLVSVRNEVERDLLEVAGSSVAQALTPLWKEVTGRT